MKKLIWCLIIAGMFSGCATTGSLDDTRNRAPSRIMSNTYNYPFEQVYTAAKLACLDLGLALESESKEQGKIYARTTANMAKIFWFGTGYGESIGIYVTPLAETQTRVEAVIQKTYKLDWGYKDYRGNLLSLIGTHLGTVEPLIAARKIDQLQPTGKPADISFFSNIQIVGERSMVDETTAALRLLQAKSPRAFSLVKDQIGTIEQSDQNWCNVDKTPSILEVNEQTVTRSTTWLAAAIAKGAYLSRGQRRGETSVALFQKDGGTLEEDTSRYHQKILSEIDAPKDERVVVAQ